MRPLKSPRSARSAKPAAPATRISARSRTRTGNRCGPKAPLRGAFCFSVFVMLDVVARSARSPIRLLLGLVLGTALGGALAQGDAKRGEYLAKAGGCIGCHTEEKKDAVPFAGGRALKSPFGTFYGPNITPHPEAGIGRWTEADFVRAIRLGERPDGKNYFPAFPYPSFTKIVDRDLRDLWAYLRTLAPSPRANQEHEMRFPFGWRFLVAFWKWFFFTPGPFTNLPGLSDIANRGAYLVQALGHCGQCHTPRPSLGGPKTAAFPPGGSAPHGKTAAKPTPG